MKTINKNFRVKSESENLYTLIPLFFEEKLSCINYAKKKNPNWKRAFVQVTDFSDRKL